MNSLRLFKVTFENPELVAKIQNFFGVSYNEVIPMNPAHADKPLLETVLREENGTSFRKNSKQHPTDYYEPKENNEQSKENATYEDATKLDANSTSVDTSDRKNYTVKNKFWYYLFYFGTYLGDEVGYALFLPFWFWNIDGVVGRKLVLVWTIVMYVGQSIKDVVRWPRPKCPPVIRLQKKWSLEYGMPSTHAMVGVAFPSSLLYYSCRRYDVPVGFGVVISALWCILISLSRLYLGMHSVLDIMAGLLLSSVLVIPLIPAMNYVDDVFLKADWYPPALFIISMILLYFYPSRDTWTPTKGDTSSILGTCVGNQVGWWLNFKCGIVKSSGSPVAHNIEILDWPIIRNAVLCTVVGLVGIGISFLVFEVLFKITDKLFKKMNITVRDSETRRRIPILDVSYKNLCYTVTSFHVVCSLPFLFKICDIGRKSYYEE